MTHYKVDERDIHFNLFEYLDFDGLPALPPYKDQGSDLYKMVLAEALKFSFKEISPLFETGDRDPCKLIDGKVHVPKGYKETYQTFAENGFLSMDVPTQWGGQGLPSSLMVACYEYFTGANVAFSMYAGLTRGASHVIETFAEDRLKQLFCPVMYAGRWAGTMCLTEPDAGSSVGDLNTTATPAKNGLYSIKGNKIFISSGDHELTENIIHLVLARVAGDAPGTKGLSLFIVPKLWVNEDGSLGKANDVVPLNVEHKMGIKAQATLSLNFGENGKCLGFLVGKQSEGMKYMFKLMNEARLMTGLQGLAIAGTAYEQARGYAKEREQGGKTIVHYPDVRRNLALCKVWVEGMRALLYKTAVTQDLAKHHTDADVRDKLQDEVELAIPICKAYLTDFGFKVTEIALQVFGGAGYIDEYPMEQYVRDAKIGSIYEGTNGIQAMDLMGRKLPRKNGQLFRAFYDDTTALIAKTIETDPFKEIALALQKALNATGQVVLKMAELGMSGNRNIPLLSATPFLEMCGHVMIARCLLEQAVIAQDKIGAGSQESFYSNKILSAQFFAAHVLPLAGARAKEILTLDESAMKMVF